MADQSRDPGRIAALRRLLDEDPRSLSFVALAEELCLLGQYGEASTVAQRGLLAHPDSVAGRLVLAKAEAEQGRVREALEQIKRALLIDPENAQALALMGQILLRRGLAQRALQFLSHAVKLAPEEREYAQLLERARAATSDDGGPGVGQGLSRLSGDQVPNMGSPWSDDRSDEGEDREARSESMHTVFDARASQRLGLLGASRQWGEGARGLPSTGDGSVVEEPTAFEGSAALHRGPAPKMGGSAAELSRMMRADQEGSVPGPAASELHDARVARPRDLSHGARAAEALTRIGEPPKTKDAPSGPKKAVPGPSVPPIASSSGEPESKPKPIARSSAMGSQQASSESQPASSVSKPASLASKPPSSVPPSVAASDPARPSEASSPPRSSLGSAVPDVGRAAKPRATPDPVRDAPQAEAAAPREGAAGLNAESAAALPSESPPSPGPVHSKSVGPASTRMVDEALWALLGGRSEAPPGASPAPAEEKPAEKRPKKSGAEEKEKEKEKEREKEDEGSSKPRPQKRVVRTSRWFGFVARAALILLLSLSALFAGYASTSRIGSAPELASEELRGLATDLEAGGLAALHRAESTATDMRRNAPSLAPLLSGVLAEIYARRYVDFGRDPKLLAAAQEALSTIRDAPPTVEALAARVLVSTSAVARSALLRALDQTLVEYPRSPKTWSLKAKIAEMDGDEDRAAEALYNALAINPNRRATLLGLARWHARRGSFSAAFDYSADILDQGEHAEDIEVVLERYALGQMTGLDPTESRTVATLAGLVREELVEVAKEETARAAFLFALSHFVARDFSAGREQLAKAEGAYPESPDFQAALGAAFLAIGEWTKARRCYELAARTAPENPAHRIGIARALLGERASLTADFDALKKRQKDVPSMRGVALLPFGTMRFSLDRFLLAKTELDATVFPEAQFQSVVEGTPKERWPERLEAVALAAAAAHLLESGRTEDATATLRDAARLEWTPLGEIVHGRLLVRTGKPREAVRVLRAAVEKVGGGGEKAGLGAERPGAGAEATGDKVALRLALVVAHVAADQLPDARKALEALKRDGIVAPEAELSVARLMLKRGEEEAALTLLRSAREAMPKNAAVRITLGTALHQAGRPEADVLEAFGRAVESTPNVTPSRLPEDVNDKSPVVLFYLGRVALDRGDMKKGVVFLRAARARGRSESLPIDFYLGKALLSSRATRSEGVRLLERFGRSRRSPPGLAAEARALAKRGK